MIHRGNWFWWLIAAVLVVVILPAGIVVIAGIVVAVAYLVSLAVHPFMNCRSCKGTGRHPGYVFGYSHRQCGSCGGQGRHRRFGMLLFYRGRQSRAEARAQAARDTRPSRPL